MKTLNVFLLIVLFFSFINCTKIGKNVTIKGRVINPVNNEPIAEKKVYLYRNNFKTIKRTNTNENGEFELSVARFGPIWAEVSYDYKEYYSLGWDYEGKYYSALKVDKGEVMNVDYHLVPYGLIKLNIDNINCTGLNDTMWFRKKWIGYSDFDYYSTPRAGCYSYTSPMPFELPMGKYIYETKVKRSGNITYVYDTVTVNESGVSMINIDY